MRPSHDYVAADSMIRERVAECQRQSAPHWTLARKIRGQYVVRVSGHVCYSAGAIDLDDRHPALFEVFLQDGDHLDCVLTVAYLRVCLGEMRPQQLEHLPVTCSERPSRAAEDDCDDGFARKAEGHYVLAAEWPVDVVVELETAKLARGKKIRKEVRAQIASLLYLGKWVLVNEFDEAPLEPPERGSVGDHPGRSAAQVDLVVAVPIARHQPAEFRHDPLDQVLEPLAFPSRIRQLEH